VLQKCHIFGLFLWQKAHKKSAYKSMTYKSSKNHQKTVDLWAQIQHNKNMMQNKAQTQQVLHKCNTAKNRQKTVDLWAL